MKIPSYYMKMILELFEDVPNVLRKFIENIRLELILKLNLKLYHHHPTFPYEYLDLKIKKKTYIGDIGWKRRLMSQ